MKKIIVTIVFLTIFLTACSTKNELLPYTEVVLKPGMVIVATNPNGTVTIKAGEGTTRIFSGKNWEKKRDLIPRANRWYGSLGLYDPATSWSPYGRLLVDEGRLYFSSISEALKYLYTQGDYFKYVYANSGLVFGYHIASLSDATESTRRAVEKRYGPEKESTRSIELWQIYINGKRPTSIPGADDSAITVSGGDIPETSTPYPAPVGYVKPVGKEEYRPEKQKITKNKNL